MVYGRKTYRLHLFSPPISRPCSSVVLQIAEKPSQHDIANNIAEIHQSASFYQYQLVLARFLHVFRWVARSF